MKLTPTTPATPLAVAVDLTPFHRQERPGDFVTPAPCFNDYMRGGKQMSTCKEAAQYNM